MRVTRHDALQPTGARRGADKDEERSGRHRLTRSGDRVGQGDRFEAGFTVDRPNDGLKENRDVGRLGDLHGAEPGSPPAESAESRNFAAGLNAPYCSTHAMLDTGAWFGEAAPHLRSFAYVPLRGEETFGLLALASEDPQRFYPEMGTLYLRRLGEIAAAGLLRNHTSAS